MITLLTVLLPTIFFLGFGIGLVPTIRFVRTRLQERSQQAFLAVWMILPSLFSALVIIQVFMEYFTFIAPITPFLVIPVSPGALENYGSSLMVDGLSLFMAIVYLIAGSLTSLFAVLYFPSRTQFSERYFALILIITGLALAASFACDLFTIFILWEAITAGSSFLIIFQRTRQSVEATFKYLIMAILASGFVLYGLSIIYSLVGSLNFWAVRAVSSSTTEKQILLLGFLFLATGFGIETAMVPFHSWLPDAYTAAPAPSSSFLSAIVDQASYYVLIRILIYILDPRLSVNWIGAFALFSAATIILGNFLALGEQEIKRMISYVVIADIGYNLIAITSDTTMGLAANLYFFLIGGLTTALAFMIIGILNASGIKTLKELKGLGRRVPLLAIPLVIVSFSFSGVPPLAGFYAKYLVFTSALEGEAGWLALVGVINSVIQTAYFLRITRIMYTSDSAGQPPMLIRKMQLLPVYIIAGILIIVGLFPSILLNLIYPVAQQFMHLS